MSRGEGQIRHKGEIGGGGGGGAQPRRGLSDSLSLESLHRGEEAGLATRKAGAMNPALSEAMSLCRQHGWAHFQNAETEGPGDKSQRCDPTCRLDAEPGSCSKSSSLPLTRRRERSFLPLGSRHRPLLLPSVETSRTLPQALRPLSSSSTLKGPLSPPPVSLALTEASFVSHALCPLSHHCMWDTQMPDVSHWSFLGPHHHPVGGTDPPFYR